MSAEIRVCGAGLIRWRVVVGCLIPVLFVSLGVSLSGELEAEPLVGTAYPVPGPHSNSGFVSLGASPSGRVYVGTTYYGGSARVWELDPETGDWTEIFDAHGMARIRLYGGLNTQSKFNTPILFDRYGVVWAVTKHGNEIYRYRPEYGEEREGYPGGYLFSYDPSTGERRNWGILMPQEGLMGGFYDRERHQFYFWSDPKQQLIRFDPVANEVTNLGAMGGGPRYLVQDWRGRIWGTVSLLSPGVAGALWMYDPESGEFADVLVRVPEGHGYREPYTLVVTEDGRRLVGGPIRRDFILDYDLETLRPSNHPRYQYELDVTPVYGMEPGFTRGMTRGLDGAIYIANSDHMLRYWPGRRELERLGPIQFAGEPDWEPVHPQGMSTGPDGTIVVKYLFIPRRPMPYSVVLFPQLSQP